MEKCNLDELLEALSEMDQAAIQQAEALSLMKITSGGVLWCWSRGKSLKRHQWEKIPQSSDNIYTVKHKVTKFTIAYPLCLDFRDFTVDVLQPCLGFQQEKLNTKLQVGNRCCGRGVSPCFSQIRGVTWIHYGLPTSRFWASKPLQNLQYLIFKNSQTKSEEVIGLM